MTTSTGINVVFGWEAKAMLDADPHNTVSNIKRLIGRNYDDPIVESEMKFLKYKI